MKVSALFCEGNLNVTNLIYIFHIITNLTNPINYLLIRLTVIFRYYDLTKMNNLYFL